MRFGEPTSAARTCRRSIRRPRTPARSSDSNAAIACSMDVEQLVEAFVLVEDGNDDRKLRDWAAERRWDVTGESPDDSSCDERSDGGLELTEGGPGRDRAQHRAIGRAHLVQRWLPRQFPAGPRPDRGPAGSADSACSAAET